MRDFQTLDQVSYDETDDTLSITCSDGPNCQPSLWLGREGMYVSISASYGPLEIALRPRLSELTACLSQLPPAERLSAMRVVGTGQAHIELGLSAEGELLLRTTIVADATGHFAMNIVLASDVRARLFEWLDVKNPALDAASVNAGE